MNRLSLLNDDMARFIWKLVYDSCVAEIKNFANINDVVDAFSFDKNNDLFANVSIYENKEDKRKMILLCVQEYYDDGSRIEDDYHYIFHYINSEEYIEYGCDSFHEAILKVKKLYKTKLHLFETHLY